MSDTEDRYEAINLIVKARADGESWFNVIADYISQDCQGSEDLSCTCGMESMGGFEGTLQQCYDWDEGVGSGLKLIDLARAIVGLVAGKNAVGPVIEWAHEEIRFEEDLEGGNSGALQGGS